MLRSSFRVLWSLIVLVALVGVLAQDIGWKLASLSLLATPGVWWLSNRVIPRSISEHRTASHVPPWAWLWIRSLGAVIVAVITPDIINRILGLPPSLSWLAHLGGLGFAILWFVYTGHYLSQKEKSRTLP